MPATDADRAFAGAIPVLYERLMVPLLFAPYAEDLAARVAALSPGRVLETACGTGAVTRQLARRLPPATEIVATDLNGPMLEAAATATGARPVRFEVVDAMSLPFDDASFDVVACQFGVMFFPDRARALSEARRVLRPGGRLLFSTWDRIEENDIADAVTQGVTTLFPSDPPSFLSRTPYGWHDVHAVVDTVRRAGFEAEPAVVSLQCRTRARSAREAAEAFCLGTPLRGEIEARDPAAMDRAIEAATRAVAARLGPAMEGRLRAHVVSVAR